MKLNDPFADRPLANALHSSFAAVGRPLADAPFAHSVAQQNAAFTPTGVDYAEEEPRNVP